MFGSKRDRQIRLEKIAETICNSNGISQAELAHQLKVARSTITKDIGVVEEKTGHLFYEMDNKLFWFGSKK